MLMFVFSFLLFFTNAACYAEVYKISNSSQFSSFVDNVNSGMSYSRTTVLLDADLSLPEITEPIGNGTNHFSGIFDGQGHVIRNLRISSSSGHIGLFGNSYKITIRNIILDSSCSITSFNNDSMFIYIGGFIGGIYSSLGECCIENSVSMASINFNGDSSNSSFLDIGGIAGIISLYFYNAYVKNCVNYGEIKYSGKSAFLEIGGITGYIHGSSGTVAAYIQNCLNYGSIMYIGTPGFLNIGGIIGFDIYGHIENCLNTGKLTLSSSSMLVGIGNFIGNSNNTHIKSCYYTSDTGTNNLYGSGAATVGLKVPSLSTAVSVAVNNLNNQVSLTSGWNKWLLNSNSKAVSFKMNNNNEYSLELKVIMLPNPSSDWRNFAGWFTDSTFETLFSADSVSNAITLYGRWDNYTVTLDANGGYVPEVSKNVTYGNAYGAFPSPSKEGHLFTGWYTEMNGESIINETTIFKSTYDVTLYANWTINQYTISFVTNGGSECPNITLDYGSLINFAETHRDGYSFVHWCKDSSLTAEYTDTRMGTDNITLYALWTANKYYISFDINNYDDDDDDEFTIPVIEVLFNSSYGVLPVPNRTGHTFDGWYTEENESVTEDTIVTIPRNHTLYAQWKEVVTNIVEILFETKGLTKEEIINIINQYTDASFTIIGFYDYESNEMKVIIEFSGVDEAVEFVKKARSLNDGRENYIKRATFSFWGISMSRVLFPTCIILLL